MIEWRVLGRLARRYPRTTTGVLLVNALPLVGVLGVGWSVGVVLVFYWLESGIVLLFTCFAALVASEPGDTSEDDLLLEGLLTSQRELDVHTHWPSVKLCNLPVALTIGAIMGFAWAIHGVFVGVFAAIVDGPDVLAPGAWIVVAALGVVATQTASFHGRYVVDERYREETARDQLSEIYLRTMVLHVALLFGGAVVMFFSAVLSLAGLALLALLVVCKAPVELAQATHRRASEDTLDAEPVLGDPSPGRGPSPLSESE